MSTPPPPAKTVTIYFGVINGFTDYPSISSITAHEMLETMTDASADNPPAGWISKTDNELCDPCESQVGTYTSTAGDLTVQGYYSNKHGRCIIPGIDDHASSSTHNFVLNAGKFQSPQVLKDMKVFLIFWGDEWNTRTTVPPTKNDIDYLIQGLMLGTFSATFFSQIGQYGVNPPTWGGSCVNAITPIPASLKISDQMVRNVVVDSINNGLIPPPVGLASGTNPGTNYWYFVYLPVNATTTTYGPSDAYHGWIPKQTITPTLAPNPVPAPVPLPTGAFYSIDQIFPIVPVILRSGATTRFGEINHIGSAGLANRTIRQVTVQLRIVGSPTGTLYCRIRYDDDTIVSGGEASIDVSTLTTTSTATTFTFPNIVFNFPNEGSKVLIEYYGGNSSNRVEVDENDGVDQDFDGPNSCSCYQSAADSNPHPTAYTINTSKDIVGVMYDNNTTVITIPGPTINVDAALCYVSTSKTTIQTSALDNITYLISHEVAEIISDPGFGPGIDNAWFTTAGNEISDLCHSESDSFGGKGANQYSDGLVVARYYSKSAGICIPGGTSSITDNTTLLNQNTYGPIVKDPVVWLIFWGTSWNNADASLKTSVISAVQNKLLGSDKSFFDGLTQYGGGDPYVTPSTAKWGGAAVNTTKALVVGNFAPNFGEASPINDVVVDSINRLIVPNPGTNYYKPFGCSGTGTCGNVSSNIIYVVLPPPSLHSTTESPADGSHNFVTVQYVTQVPAPPPPPIPVPDPNPSPTPTPTPIPTPTPQQTYRIYFAWVATKNTIAGTATDPQVYASREILNLITNPELTGYKNGGTQLTTTCLTSMGAGNYTNYTEISNTWASPFYSNANGSCILPNLNEPQLTPTNLFTKQAGGKILPVVLLEQVFYGPAWPQQFSTANPPYPLGSLDDIIQGLSNLKYFTDYYSKLSQYGILDIELDAILWNNATVLPPVFTDADIAKCLSDMFNPNNLNPNSSSFDPTQSVTLDSSDFPVPSPSKAVFCYLIFVDSSAQHANGAASGHGYFDWVAPPQGNPLPGPEPSPSPGPAPGPQGGLDVFGVQKLYPGIGGTEWVMDTSLSSPDNDPKLAFDGINSGVSSTKIAASGGTPLYYNTNSSTVSYASGGSGKTLRIGVYAGGGKGQNQINTWRSKPDFLYNTSGIRNAEYTIYLRPQSDIGLSKHHSCAFKICGGKNDSGRSILETKYPTTDSGGTSGKVQGNWDYEHPVYIAIPNITTYFTGDYFKVNTWVGLKHIHKVAADRKSSTNELWVDTTPFKADGTPSNNWKLKGSYTETGTSGFNNIPATWRGQVDRVRLDGFNSIDYTWMSIREIDPNATVGTIGQTDPTPTPTPTPLPGPPGPVPGPGQVDIFGVTKIYQDDNTGSSWVMGPIPPTNPTDTDLIPDAAGNVNLNNDSRILASSNKPSFTDNGDGSWKAKTSECRLDIVQNNGFNESSLVLDQSQLATRGYMQDTLDWGASGRGIEATCYYRVNAHSNSTTNGEAHIEHVFGGARQTNDTSSLNGFSKSCEASSYHANLYPITGRTKYEKDLKHTSGYSTNDPEVTNASYKFIDSKKWVGWKTVKYTQADGKSVKLESYIDIAGTNHWVKIIEFVDHGQWGPTRGKIGSSCGGGEFTVPFWGGPIMGLRWDNITDMDIKFASVRSINPLNNIAQSGLDQTQASTTVPIPSILTGQIVEAPPEGIVHAPNLPGVAPQTTTPSKDIFGVKNIYPSAQTGQEWYMSRTGLFGDHRVLGIPKGQAEIRNTDGSFHLQTPKAQFYLCVYITTAAGFNFAATGGTTGDQSVYRERGYMMDTRDWKNVEITFFHRMRRGINTDGGQDAGAGFIARAGQEMVGPPNCQGCGYRCSAVVDARLVTGFDKEQFFNQYAPTQLGPTYAQMGVLSPVDRFVGRKFVIYNIPNTTGDTAAVKLEHWYNDNGDGVSWKLVQEYTDTGGWGSFGSTCNGDNDQVISWGGPLVGFHWKNIQGLDYKFLSVREIDPSGQLQTGTGLTTPGPGPSGVDDINPAPKPPLVLPLIGTSIFNLSKQAYGIIYDETGGCNVGLIGGQVGATQFYTSASSNTPVNLYTGNITRFGEHAAASSVMIGKIISEVDVYMKKSGNPSGTITVNIRKGSDDSIAATIGTMQATSLTASMVLYQFTNTSHTYAIVATDKVLVEYNSGDASNFVAVDQSNASTMDGTLSYSEYLTVGGTTTPYSQTTNGASIHIYSGSKIRVGEKVVNSSSVLFGKTLGQVDVYGARATTSVTGTCYVRIRDSSDAIKFEFPSHNITDFCQTGSICASPVSFIDNTNTYALAVGDHVLFEFSGGNSTDYFRAADDNATASVDGTNTIKSFYDTSYHDETANDTMMVMKTVSGAGVYSTNTARDLEGNMWAGTTGGGGGTGGGITSTKIYSVNTVNAANHLDSNSGDYQRVGVQAATSDSLLIGQIITQVDAWISKNNSPTGTITITGRKGSDDSIFCTYGTQDISLLPTSFTLKSYTNTANTWAMQSGDKILIEYNGGDSSNYCRADETNDNQVDGTDTIAIRYKTSGGYEFKTTHEWCGNLWVGSGSTGTGGTGGGGAGLIKAYEVSKNTSNPAHIGSSDIQIRASERIVNTSSQLYNKVIKQVDLYLSRVGSPSGTATCCIRDTNDNIRVTMGTIDVTTIVQSQNDMTLYSFGNTGSTYALQAGDRISFEYSSGSSSNYIRCANDSSDPFDGSNTTKSNYDTNWNNITGSDMCGIFWV